MDLQTVLEFVGASSPRSYYLLEAFILKLLATHQEAQGKSFRAHVRFEDGAGRYHRELDGLAQDGIDNLPGPTVIEIKMAGIARSRGLLTETLRRLQDVVQTGNFKTGLLIVAGKVSNSEKLWIQNGNANVVVTVWDEPDIDRLIEQHRETAEDLLLNIEAIRLDSIVERSRAVKSDAWKETRVRLLKDLQDAYSEGELALFLGAGVSVGAGVPNWDSLLNAMLAGMIRRHDSGVISDDEIREIVARFRKIDNTSPLMVGRYLRRGLADRFADDITRFLYASVARSTNDSSAADQSAVSTLAALARICVPRRSGSGVKAVVTYNFDDLLEKQLETSGVVHRPFFAEGEVPTRDELPIYHVHGFLPQSRAKYAMSADGVEGIVFSEEGYHRLFEDPYSWSNLVQLGLLRDATAMMIGLSLTDPNLRRLLEVSAKRNERFYHYAILPRLNIDKFTTANCGESAIRTRLTAIEQFLSVHHQIQEDLFAELRVKIIWIENFTEIATLVSSIPTPAPA